MHDEQMREVVQNNLIMFGHRLPNKDIRAFLDGSIGLKPITPNFKGRAGWDANIVMLPHENATVEQPTSSGLQVSKHSVQHGSTCYLCPACKYPEPSTKKAFQLVDLDRVCKCSNCKVPSKLQDWLCMCHLKWHLCSKHQSYATQATSKSIPSSTASPVKRALGPLTLAELQEIDAKRKRKAPPRVLPPAPNLLSIKLRERFAHLFNG